MQWLGTHFYTHKPLVDLAHSVFKTNVPGWMHCWNGEEWKEHDVWARWDTTDFVFVPVKARPTEKVMHHHQLLMTKWQYCNMNRARKLANWLTSCLFQLKLEPCQDDKLSDIFASSTTTDNKQPEINTRPPTWWGAEAIQRQSQGMSYWLALLIWHFFWFKRNQCD